MEIKVKAKRWGSSLGIILPKPLVDSKRIRENDEILIEVKNRPLAGELFGRFPQWKSKKTAQELKDEMRKGWQ